ncbi:ParB/RepB/Spo0J family partition protein [Clavibacter michiganensis]|uniref:ParB/RepB/Spo0J family partition protein n=3 Tax=Clavibacter michiganensis TaxID=28447 RepID=UPI000B369C66|nr:ParB N-terminal domain-containing protein [Clavibacter michiganensis]MWJ05189.1 chromosome partitioning protein [Clavibacter michiganensis subsp. michiganensis]MWJ11211.1 chromosome partitioning protein [Clavibacter michiganensis subsp. michiganensis]MWJ23577.1 chromosome partitioning protein [Clavibacter michiganensis subsp. michiganensis]MWJ46222.1 chromosome partitioning protein [Clavibacter michiganensis subsp. michiganensis]OUD94899.1 Chromosome-partitioning protein Spo0J [Clavibacter 
MTITENTTSPVGVIEYLDPNTLIIEENVRPSADLNREFVQSIRANGVLTPVRARRDAEGRVLVRAGQRRTLAAREVGLATIAVHIIEGDEATAERIVQQLVENDQRLALTDADRTVAFKQLEFAGLTPAAISKRTGTKTATVKTTLQVANTPAAADAMAEHQLTLDQAAGLVEFDDDEEARASLIKTAVTVPAQFEHELQRARDERARREALQAAITDHESRGYVIVDHENPEHEAFVPVFQLVTADGRYPRLSAEEMDALDGRGARIVDYFDGPEATYYLRDPEAVGFRRRQHETPAEVTMTDEQKAEQKAERRRVIANNKAWDSAETVRRTFVASLVTRKALPKNAVQVIAAGLTTYRHEVGRAVQEGSPLAHEFLGVARERGYYSDALGQYAAATPTKAQHVALAVVLGGIEASLSRESWRSAQPEVAEYLRQLAAWGYPLSEVEQLIVNTDEKRRAARDADDDADDADADTAAAETDTDAAEVDTATVEDGHEPITADPSEDPEPDPAEAA